MKLPNTLFYKTASTLALSLLLLSIITLATTAYFIVIPVVKRSADDLASFLVLATQTWDGLAIKKQEGFKQQLYIDYGIRLRTTAKKLEPQKTHNIFIYRQLIFNALNDRLGQTYGVTIGTDPNEDGWIWVSLKRQETILQYGLAIDRVGASPPIVILFMLIAIFLLVLGTALILAQRLSHPLQQFSQVASAVAKGEIIKIDETKGPDELRVLAKKFNRMSYDVFELLQNRTTLLAGISHDLRTPLTRIRLALELKSNSTSDVLDHDLESDIEQMEQLLERALLLARGVDDKEPKVKLDLVKLIATLGSQFEAEWLMLKNQNNSKVKFEVDASFADSPAILLPKQSLIRVLSNLIENSLRYGKDKPVLIKLSKVDSRVCISVIDKGATIPKEKLELVFRPFYRLESSRNLKTGGTGLGLAIVKQLCDGWGWDVRFMAGKESGNEVQLLLN